MEVGPTTRANGAAIELLHVTKAFSGKRVLDDVTLTVAKGRSLCILGRSGTGKSVTLKHMVGLVSPDAGRVLIEGTDLSGLSPAGLASSRGPRCSTRLPWARTSRSR
jgi:phospholipid/cholesterol/gamma-HCH transport system ATP-binding protein